MTEKFRTQAMGDGEHKGEVAGINGASDADPKNEARSNPYAEAPGSKPPKRKWHGGQSVAGYHGPQQVGDKVVTPEGNPNSPSKS